MANKAPGEHRRNTSLSEKLKNGQTDLRKTQNRKPKNQQFLFFLNTQDSDLPPELE